MWCRRSKAGTDIGRIRRPLTPTTLTHRRQAALQVALWRHLILQYYAHDRAHACSTSDSPRVQYSQRMRISTRLHTSRYSSRTACLKRGRGGRRSSCQSGALLIHSTTRRDKFPSSLHHTWICLPIGAHALRTGSCGWSGHKFTLYQRLQETLKDRFDR